MAVEELSNTFGRAHETETLGTSIAWAEMGDGEPLILLHGLADSHRTWRRAAPILAEHFRCLMPDLPGYGNSGRPDAPYTLSWHSQVLCSWMDSIGIGKAHFCGHSFGSGVSQWMLLEHRDRIDRLALISAGGFGREVYIGLRFASFPLLGRKISPLFMRFIAPAALKLSPKTFGNIEPEEREYFIKVSRLPGSDRAFQRSLENVINFFGQQMQTIDRAHEISDMPPIALFWGSDDPIIPARHGLDAISRSEGITLTIYEGCGHFPHLDAPEKLSRDLIDFLKDPSPPPARYLPPSQNQKGIYGLLRRPEYKLADEGRVRNIQ